ncbi:MAG: hypothetical protein ACLQU9_11680 [Acidimicrobiales bacterium]
MRNRSGPVRPALARLATGLVAAGLVAGSALGAVAAPVGASSGSGSASLAQARKAELVLADLPAGWVTAKNTNNDNSTVGDAQLAHCVGVATSLITENPPSVNSPQFQDSSGTLIVNDNVTLFPSAKNAAAELGVGANPKMPGCMTSLASGPLKAKLFGKTPKGVSIGTPLVSAIAPGAFGPGVVGYSLSVPVVTHGVTLNFTATQLYAVKGRLGQQVMFTAVGAPFSIAEEQHLMSVAVGRL